MLSGADELAHRPGPEPKWQENYFVLGLDEDQSAGFYLHVERMPGRAEVDLKGAVFNRDRVVSVTERHPLPPVTDPGAPGSLDAPGVEWNIEEPMVAARVRMGLKGHDGDTPWLAQPGPGTAAAEFDVLTRSRLGVLDWREVFDRLGIPGIEGEHYEVAGTWEGTVTVADETITGRGLCVRDHSWGPRDFSDFDHALWTPMVFDEGSAFVTGVAILRNDGWTGFTLIQTPGSVDVVPDPVVRLSGRPGPRGYSGATVVVLPPGDEPMRFEARAVRHIPAQYPDFAPGYYMNDALCTVDWGDRHGFGVIELNTR